MSGLEVVGLTASIVQLGGAGAELSKALYVFLRSATRAESEIADLAEDIGSTCTALDSVKDVLKSTGTTSTFSQDAISRAFHIIRSCNTIFSEISAILEKGRKTQQDGTKRVTFWGKCSWPLKEKDVRDLSRRLQGLKLSLLLLLNVLQLAQGQVRGQLESELQEKSETIRRLWAQLESFVAKANIQGSASGLEPTTLLTPSPTPSLPTLSMAALPATSTFQSIQSTPHLESGVCSANVHTPGAPDGSTTSPKTRALDDENDEHLTLDELAKCANHVHSLLQHITDLQNGLKTGRDVGSHRKRRLHKTYQRYRREFMSDILSPELPYSMRLATKSGPYQLESNSKSQRKPTQTLNHRIAPASNAFRQGTSDLMLVDNVLQDEDWNDSLTLFCDGGLLVDSPPTELHSRDIEGSFSSEIHSSFRYATPIPTSPTERDRKKHRPKEARSTQGDWELIREMDPDRPDLAIAIAQEALNPDPETTKSSDEEMVDLFGPSDSPVPAHARDMVAPSINVRSDSLADATRDPIALAEERRASHTLHATSTGSCLDSVRFNTSINAFVYGSALNNTSSHPSTNGNHLSGSSTIAPHLRGFGLSPPTGWHGQRLPPLQTLQPPPELEASPSQRLLPVTQFDDIVHPATTESQNSSQPQKSQDSPAESNGNEAASKQDSRRINYALKPKISPSIKHLSFPGENGISNNTQALLQASRSQYRDDDGSTTSGISYPVPLSTSLTSKRTSFKLAEQGRRNRINTALQDLQDLLPSSSGTIAEFKSSKATKVESAVEYIKQLKEELLAKDELLQRNGLTSKRKYDTSSSSSPETDSTDGDCPRKKAKVRPYSRDENASACRLEQHEVKARPAPEEAKKTDGPGLEDNAWRSDDMFEAGGLDLLLRYGDHEANRNKDIVEVLLKEWTVPVAGV
ncbi:hypothetical protein BU25DRAFT_492674 [Macroventuria anomochaeta]|uniref:Uncharacterized protein n=1 Tax=Macroventuria anomochaeta TaxID=301207 RepID=A0ACB6RWY3_9PLEO|nr:uncharacterized protein BU25DRAFT_492674 [Macroventuria anomochaeta]KAF2625767.1 hypothetical protein BU25DRAFT_492674 [Macroventuria anomochaeta]